MANPKLRFGRPTTVPPVVSERLAASALTASDTAEDNRRLHPRLETERRARVTLHGQDYHVMVTDLGDGGICCHPLPYWIRRGDPILISMRDHTVMGRVAWRRTLSDQDDDLLVGVRFSRPHPELTDLEDMGEASL
jgi:hypothetical protein